MSNGDVKALLEVKKLTKSYGNKKVLQDLSFTLYKGQILGLVGKSGAGKSTLMRLLSFLEEPTSGKIEFNGEVDKKQFIGYSFQANSFYEELSLKDNLYYFGQIYGIDKNTVEERANLLFGLTDLSLTDMSSIVSSLSGGMKKRFDIVLALLHEPELLILDEPTAGLDPLRRKQLLNVIRRIQSAGVTIIISSHLMTDITESCSEALVLDRGKKLILDKPEKIRNELLDHEEIRIESTPGNYKKIISYLKGFNILHAEERNGKLIVYTPESEILLHYILHVLENNDETLQDIVVTEPDLEDVFEAMNGKKPERILRTNVARLNDFVKSLIGKKYSPAQVKEILLTHKWPKEITNALIGKHMRRVK